MNLTAKSKVIYFVALPIAILLLTSLFNNETMAVIGIIILYATLLGWIFYGYWLWIRWIANTAANAGRSYKGFLVFGFFLPVLASIIVLTFKRD